MPAAEVQSTTEITTENSVKNDTCASLTAQLNLLQVAHDTADRRLVSRVLHSLPKTRKSLTGESLRGLLENVNIKGSLR